MDNIKQKTKIGIFWNAFEKVFVQGVSFVLNIILARLLSPHDYGTIGMLTVFLTFSNVFVDSGFSRALIQRQDRTERDFSTVLIFNVAVSCLLYLILFLASPAISSFYAIPDLVSLQRVFFLVIVLNSLTVVQSAQLQIQIDFRRIALINATATVLSGCLAVVAAYKGLGVWSLVVQSLSKAGISALCFWIAGRWIPSTGFSFESFRRLFGFGSKLLVSGFLGVTVTNINSLVIGKIYTPASLGYYTRAQQFPDVVSGTLNSVLNTSTFPMMAALQDRREELLMTFRRLVKLTALAVVPAMMGIAVLSKNIILVLLGEKWLPASDMLFWLALSYVFLPINALNLNLLNAIGRSDLFLKVDAAKIPIIFATMAITFPISLKAVVIGKAVTALIYFFINAFMIGRLYNFGGLRQLLHIWKIIVSAVVMFFSVGFVLRMLPSNFMGLLLCIVFGVVVYLLMLLVLREEEVFVFARKLLARRGPYGR